MNHNKRLTTADNTAHDRQPGCQSAVPKREATAAGGLGPLVAIRRNMVRAVIYLRVLLLLALTSCNGQTKYFQPIGIIDKTEELKRGRVEWRAIQDKERVDGYTRIGDSIFGGEIACNIKPLEGIDIKTFQVLAGTQYARDKHHVYYPLETHCIDYTDCGVCYYSKFIVETATPSSLRYLGKEYATDGKNVYFRGELLPQADGATFKVIEGPQYFYFATDKANVYRHNTVFGEADPATFYFDQKDPRTIDTEYEHKYIIGDKNKEWEFVPPGSIKQVNKN